MTSYTKPTPAKTTGSTLAATEWEGIATAVQSLAEESTAAIAQWSAVSNELGAISTALPGKADVGHTHTAAQVSDSTATGRSMLTAADSAAARTAIGAGTSNLTIGTTSTTAAAGNDSRLTNARTPTAHAASHASGGSDQLSIAASQITGTLPVARLGTGTAEAGTYVDGGTGAWTTLPAVGTGSGSVMHIGDGSPTTIAGEQVGDTYLDRTTGSIWELQA